MTEIRIAVKNASETGGTFLTPTWFGFHNGSFDLFNSGETASAGLEQLAEDGSAAGLGSELLEADAGNQGVVLTGAAGPIATQEQTSMIIDIDGGANQYVNYAAMLLPSNDAFIGNGTATKIFSDDGSFLGETNVTISGAQVYDAGTEVNTELDAAFINQTAPNTGIDENGSVALHPGFNGSLGNPVGDGDQIILGGTNAFGEPIDPVAADFTQPGAQIAEIHINTVNRVEGTDGRDIISGGRDDDIVNAGGGNDIVFGARGWDVIDGGSGRDFLFGGAGNDELSGGDGRDKIWGGRDDDIISGGNGKDWLGGGRGDDFLDGGNGRDDLSGGSGNDVLLGGDGRDWLNGGSGNDLLNGGAGNDSLRGGGGEDTFVFSGSSGNDVVLDFRQGQDRLAFDIQGIDDATDLLDGASQGRRGVTFDLGEGSSVFVRGADLSWLEESDFVIA